MPGCEKTGFRRSAQRRRRSAVYCSAADERLAGTTLFALAGIAVALPAVAAPKGEFKAQFRDDDCLSHTLCGTGLVEGYGQATTTVDITGGDFDPATGCLINVTAVRDIELVGDPSSTLTLALTDEVICGNAGSASFTIAGGTGVPLARDQCR